MSQNDDEKTVDLPPYQIRSYWFNHHSNQDYQSGFSNADLGKHHSSDIASVLQQAAPEVGIIRKAGTSNDVIIRGISQDNLTVTIDDGKVFPCCSNRMDPPISQISSAMVETIELTQGAFDLKSAGSLGGSIRIVTKEPSAEEMFSSSLQIGSFSQYTASLLATGGNDVFNSVFNAEYSQSDPYEDGSGRRMTDFPDSSAWAIDDYLEQYRDEVAFKVFHAATKLRWKLDDSSHIQGSYRFRQDEDVLYPGLRMDADLTKTHEFAITYENTEFGDPDRSLEIHVFHNWTRHDMSDLRRKSSELNPMGMPRPQYVLDRGWFMESISEGSTSGLQATYSKTGRHLKWESGLEFTQRDWDINNRLGGGMPMAGPAAEIFNDMIPDTRSQVLGVFAQAEYLIETGKRLDFGIRLDRYETTANDPLDFLTSQIDGSDSKEEWVPSAKLVFRQDLDDSTSWFAGIGTTARIPNGQERYIQLQRPGTMPNWLGNPELDSPRNTEIASGISTQTDKLSWNAKVFYSWIQDYIYLGRLTTADSSTLTKNTQSFFNIDAILYGLDTSVSWMFHENWAFYTGISWQRGKKETFPPNNNSNDLGEIPPLKGVASLRYVKDHWECSLEALYADSQDNVDSNIGEIVLDSYVVLNLRTRFNISDNLHVSLGVENLTDTTYASHNAIVRNPFSTFTVVNEPGRLFYLNLEMHW